MIKVLIYDCSRKDLNLKEIFKDFYPICPGPEYTVIVDLWEAHFADLLLACPNQEGILTKRDPKALGSFKCDWRLTLSFKLVKNCYYVSN